VGVGMSISDFTILKNNAKLVKKLLVMESSDSEISNTGVIWLPPKLP